MLVSFTFVYWEENQVADTQANKMSTKDPFVISRYSLNCTIYDVNPSNPKLAADVSGLKIWDLCPDWLCNVLKSDLTET